MGILQDLRSLMSKVDTGVAQVQRGVEEYRRTIAETKARMRSIESAFCSRDELERRAAAIVATRAAWWLEEHGKTLLYGDQSLALSSVERNHHVMRDETQLMTFPALCGADPEAAGHLVLALLDRAGYVPGLAPDARRSELARLARELATLEADEERAIDAAAAAGVTIAHRPEVVTRRQNEAREQQLHAERIASKQDRQAKLDHGAERRVMRSEYLRERQG